MATVYATQNIVADDSEGKRVEFMPGEVVEGLSQDVVNQLAELGALSNSNPLEEVDASVDTSDPTTLEAENKALKEQIAQLQAQVDAAQPANPEPPTA